jgi:hypothetical protein
MLRSHNCLTGQFVHYSYLCWEEDYWHLDFTRSFGDSYSIGQEASNCYGTENLPLDIIPSQLNQVGNTVELIQSNTYVTSASLNMKQPEYSFYYLTDFMCLGLQTICINKVGL